MIVCLKTRLGEIHIISWNTSTGVNYTMCGKIFYNKQHIETFSSDNTFPDMCRNCYLTQEAYNQDIIDHELRDWSSDHVISNSKNTYAAVQKGRDSTESKYEGLARRAWPKAKRMRRKFPAKDIKKNRRRYGTEASILIGRK
jgi:hypothetical protein